MPRRVLIVLIAGAFLALLVGPRAWAGPPTDQLRGQVDRVLKILSDPGLKTDGKRQERRVAIRKVANDIFDFTELTKRSLGRHWQARTPADQAEFVELFTDLLEYAYISKIEMYTGEKIAFVGETLDGGVATVRTKIVTKQGTEIPLDYRMYQRGDRWLTYDVTVEGISLVSNYRTQFNAIIQRSSYQELVRTMRAKQDARPGEPAAEAPRPAAPREAP
jgi:phospholipid transport system substrate-binding protein